MEFLPKTQYSLPKEVQEASDKGRVSNPVRIALWNAMSGFRYVCLTILSFAGFCGDKSSGTFSGALSSGC